MFQVNLLNVKTSMNVNIFLKQFPFPNEEIIRLVREGRAERINSTRLKGLLNILPEPEEVCAMVQKPDGLEIVSPFRKG